MIDKGLEKVNSLPVNQYAATLLPKFGGYPNYSEIHVLQLLRLFLEEGKLPESLRLGDDLEGSILSLIDMQDWNPKKAAKLLELENLDNLSPNSLIDELLERVNDLQQQNLL